MICLTGHRGLRRGRLLVDDRGAGRGDLRVHACHPLAHSHGVPQGVWHHPAEVGLRRNLGRVQAVVVREVEHVWKTHQGQDGVDGKIAQRPGARGVPGRTGTGAIATGPAGPDAHETSVGTASDADKLRECKKRLIYHADGFNMSRIFMDRLLCVHEGVRKVERKKERKRKKKQFSTLSHELTAILLHLLDLSTTQLFRNAGMGLKMHDDEILNCGLPTCHFQVHSTSPSLQVFGTPREINPEDLIQLSPNNRARSICPEQSPSPSHSLQLTKNNGRNV